MDALFEKLGPLVACHNWVGHHFIWCPKQERLTKVTVDGECSDCLMKVAMPAHNCRHCGRD